MKIEYSSNKFLFIHLPKCGGMSMEHICRNNGILIDPRNANTKYLNEKFNTDVYCSFEDQKKLGFSFSFIRNPYDRVVSSWKCPWVSGKKISKNNFTNQFHDFRDFVFNFLPNEHDFSFFRWSHVMPFTDPRFAIFDDKQELQLSFLGKLETYQEDFDFVCNSINIKKQKLPHKNKTHHKKYTEYYDKELINIISEFYAKDIEYGNYEFGQ